MENSKKCSNKNHREIEATNYCIECNVYLCKKCLIYHSELLEAHHISKLDKNINEIFTGLCPELNHRIELSFFCKTHNQLCCAACLSKMKENGNGQHRDCEVCLIDEIKEEKKSNLDKNIKLLESLSAKIENSINELKILFKNINDKKEEMKLNVSKIFTKIRSAINEREDQILLEIDKQYNEYFFNENFLKICDKLPNQIKLSLENGKSLNGEWDNDKRKINYKIFDCINIENNIKNINELKGNIEACNSKNIDIEFLPDDDGINLFLEKIKIFGQICKADFKFKFKPGKNYSVSDNGLIATKNNGGNNWNCTIIGNREIPKNRISKWKIKLNSSTKQSWDILIGIGPDNPNNEKDFYNKCWTFLSSNSQIINKSNGTSNYYKNKERLKKGDIVEVLVDRKIGNLSYAVNGLNYGLACSEIPKDDILFPIIILYDQELSVEIV